MNQASRANTWWHRLIAIFVLVGLFAGCQTIRDLSQIKKPELSIKTVRLTDLTFDSLTLVTDLQIKNPNRLSATLRGFDYDLDINGNSFVKGRQDNKVVLPSMGENSIGIPMTLRFSDLYKTFQSMKNEDSAAYKISLGLDFELPVIGDRQFPVSKEGYIPLPKLPVIKVNSLRVKKMSFSGADLELELKVSNPNAFAMSFDNLKYNLEISGQSWVTGAVPEMLQIGKSGENTLTIPVSIKFAQMGQTLYQVLMQKSAIDYRFQGNVDLKTSIPIMNKVNLPIDMAGKLNILR